MITSELYLTLQIGSRRHIPKKLRKAGALLSKKYIELFAMYNGYRHRIHYIRFLLYAKEQCLFLLISIQPHQSI
jgi:hypothetical protein